MSWFGPRTGSPESVKHFLEELDELTWLQLEVFGFREQIETGGPDRRTVAAGDCPWQSISTTASP
jgi:hypothetical protein